jgi:succinyl-diaminopimelate desuccinylase
VRSAHRREARRARARQRSERAMTDTFAGGKNVQRAPRADADTRTGDSVDSRTASIVDLLTRLVRIPSRGGVDPTGPVLECIERWFAQHAPALPHRRVMSARGEPLGLYAEIRGTGATAASHHSSDKATGHASDSKRYYLLNATLDTAGFGDEAVWTQPPLAANVVDSWLYGRGAADSKVGAALFAHLLVALSQRTGEFAGRVGLLLDLDEHTGRFGCARAFFDNPVDTPVDNTGNIDSAGDRSDDASNSGKDCTVPHPDGVLIGYPGHERLMVGARGFLRARLVVHGTAAHAGSSSSRGLNAAVRGGALANALHDMPLPSLDDGTFDRQAQLTVTGIRAGDSGFTAVPDRCELTVDIRLTPRFDARRARALIADAIRAHDIAYTASPANNLLTDIEWIDGWPAYRVPDTHPMVSALCRAAQRTFGAAPSREVAGPSNIGNYLASLSIPALCGFGPRGEQLHANDERVELSSIAPVYQVYEDTLLDLLRPTPV